MRDRRNDSVWVILLRVVVFGAAVAVALSQLYAGAQIYGAPWTEIQRFHQPPAPFPHVLVRGKLARRTATQSLPALSVVEHEKWVSCGKHYCWRTQESFHFSDAIVKVGWSSAPLPDTMNLDWSFEEQPWRFPQFVVTSNDRAKAWIAFARSSNIAFGMPEPVGIYATTSSDRIVEYTADTDEPVYISACVSPTRPNFLEKCPGQTSYGIVYNGDDQAARDDGGDDIAMRLAGGMAALLVAALAWFHMPKPIIEGLEDRAATHQRTLKWAYALFLVAPVAGFVALLLHASIPPSTWASGRGGFACAIIVMAAWLFFMFVCLLRRKNTLIALGPVLTTPRKPLAEASGTVELAVKAKLRNGGVRAYIGDDVVAYSELKIWETYTQGKNTSKHLISESRQRNELGVVDESSEGTLDLQRSILEVELREASFKSLPATYAERGIVAIPHARHIQYKVEERVIKDGESLFVFGDVSGIALQSDEGGYRSVRGSPTLGGADAAPVLVYSGSQKGLVEMLTREARVANTYAVVAMCLCGAMALSLGALAML